MIEATPILARSKWFQNYFWWFEVLSFSFPWFAVAAQSISINLNFLSFYLHGWLSVISDHLSFWRHLNRLFKVHTFVILLLHNHLDHWRVNLQVIVQNVRNFKTGKQNKKTTKKYRKMKMIGIVGYKGVACIIPKPLLLHAEWDGYMRTNRRTRSCTSSDLAHETRNL